MDWPSPDRIVQIILGLAAAGGLYTTQTAPDVMVWQVELQRQAERWHQELERTRVHEAARCDALIARACD